MNTIDKREKNHSVTIIFQFHVSFIESADYND